MEADRPWRRSTKLIVGDALIVVGLTLLASAMAAGIFAVTGVAEGSPARTLAVLLGFHAVLTGYGVYHERRKLTAWFRPDPRSLLLGVGGAAVLIVLGLLNGLLLQGLDLPIPDVATWLVRSFPMPVLVLWVAVLAPVGEEIYFRGRLTDALQANHGNLVAACLMSLLFALIHGVPLLFPVYGLFGLVFFGLRRWSGGLVAPVLAHLINNGVGLVVSR